MHVQRSFGRRGHDEGNCDMCNVARSMESRGNVVKGQDGEEEGASPQRAWRKESGHCPKKNSLTGFKQGSSDLPSEQITLAAGYKSHGIVSELTWHGQLGRLHYVVALMEMGETYG